MTLDELKTESEKLGYRLVKNQPYIRLLPCTCGRKKVEEWFGVRDNHFYACPRCGKKSPPAKTTRGARISWNEMIEKETKEERGWQVLN